MIKEIGFIGLGRMGGPMAGRLVDAGYSIHVSSGSSLPVSVKKYSIARSGSV
jgi:3-hydroxyisobutyrate dehydrogenase-like beta-hydroxyacid dehydrogenase